MQKQKKSNRKQTDRQTVQYPHPHGERWGAKYLKKRKQTKCKKRNEIIENKQQANLCVCVHTHTHTHTHIYLRKLTTVVDGDLKAPFLIATTPKCSGGRYSFLWIASLTLDLYFIMLSVKQGGIKFHFF